MPAYCHRNSLSEEQIGNKDRCGETRKVGKQSAADGIPGIFDTNRSEINCYYVERRISCSLHGTGESAYE